MQLHYILFTVCTNGDGFMQLCYMLYTVLWVEVGLCSYFMCCMQWIYAAAL